MSRSRLVVSLALTLCLSLALVAARDRLAPAAEPAGEGVGGSALALKEGPYLQWTTSSAVTVMWETTVAADSTLRYRREGDTWRERHDSRAVKIHEIRLFALDAGETVEYSVASHDGDSRVESGVHSLRTAPPEPGPFAFTVWGDNQTNPLVFGSLVQRMARGEPDLAMSVGDVVDDGDDYESWGRELLRPLRPLASWVPFYVAIGNHEKDSHWFYDYLAQPGNEHWFSFDYSGCHFVVIDTNYPFTPGSAQYRWLESDLFSRAAREARWLFTFHHHPPYSEIYEEFKYGQVRSFLVPLFEEAGVDVDFSGHIHDYERGIWVPPDTGRRIAWVQTSGAGGRLWEDEYDGEWDQIETVIQYVYHYCRVDVEGSSLRLRAIDTRGRVIDSFELTALPRQGETPPEFRRGDANADRAEDLPDAVAILFWLFQGGGGEPPCIDAADVDDGGDVDLTDAVYLLSHLFRGSPPPPPPWGGCGPDPTPDALSCELELSCP